MAFEASARGKIYVMPAHIPVAETSHIAKPGFNRAKIPPNTGGTGVTLHWMRRCDPLTARGG